MFQHWINFILGLWLIISAYVGFTAVGMTTNLVIVGVVVAILGLWGGLASTTYSQEQQHRHA